MNLQFLLSFHLTHRTLEISIRKAFKNRLKVFGFWYFMTSFVTSFSRKFSLWESGFDSEFFALSTELKKSTSRNFFCKKFFNFIFVFKIQWKY